LKRGHVASLVVVCLYIVMSVVSVDQFELRCAIAVVVDARCRLDVLTDANVLRLDAALSTLGLAGRSLDGPVARSVEALLSVEYDYGGLRTVRAISDLAVQFEVTQRSATSLASSFSASM
jgi:hypothetical protein